MPQPSRPRKGSLGFGPRKRSTSETPRFNSWPSDDGQPGVQGFAGYKAGMTHVVLVNDEPNSPREAVAGETGDDRFDLWLNTVPNQGSEVVRTEEALFATLAPLTLEE